MRTILLNIATILGVAWSGTLQAVIIDNATAIPDSEVIINFDGTGLDWVYAGPIAPNEFGPGNIQEPSYRAGEGWRFATEEEWAIRPDWQDFTRPGETVPAPVAGYDDHDVYRFASEYWGDFTHVDLNDANNGLITNGFDIGSLTGVWETFYVRGTRVAPDVVPEPSVLALIVVGMLGLGAARRHR